jgi:hypothetical protein
MCVVHCPNHKSHDIRKHTCQTMGHHYATSRAIGLVGPPDDCRVTMDSAQMNLLDEFFWCPLLAV